MRRRRRPTLHHAVKNKRVTVRGPVKQPEMDFMSHRGGGVLPFLGVGLVGPLFKISFLFPLEQLWWVGLRNHSSPPSRDSRPPE